MEHGENTLPVTHCGPLAVDSAIWQGVAVFRARLDCEPMVPRRLRMSLVYA